MRFYQSITFGIIIIIKIIIIIIIIIYCCLKLLFWHWINDDWFEWWLPCVIVLFCCSFVELGQVGTGGLSVLRTFRLLRILKLVRFMPALRYQLVIMLKTMDNVATFFSLLVLFIFIFRWVFGFLTPITSWFGWNSFWWLSFVCVCVCCVCMRACVVCAYVHGALQKWLLAHLSIVCLLINIYI